MGKLALVLVPALLLVLVLVGACSSDPDGTLVPDAASLQPDAPPYTCQAIAHGPPPACLALDAAALQGTTPFGTLDLALHSFGAGDCITISAATISWVGACGEELTLQFPYPVSSGTSGRSVTTSFDADGRFSFVAPSFASRSHTGAIHVDVVTWQENAADGTHDLDITLTIVDTAFALAPLRLHGTFCDWPFHVC